jgi:RecA-family ATPase
MLLQHPAQAGETDGSGQSGSRVWRNSVRSMMLLGRVPDEDPEDPSDERVLRFTKANYGKRRKGMRIEWKDGLFVPCTIAAEKGGLSQFDRLELRAKIERELIHRINSGEQFTLARNSPKNVAVQFHRDKSWHRYDKREIAESCDTMLKEGRLVQIETGPESRRDIRVRPASILYPSERAPKKPQKTPTSE